ncbi:MAG: cytochrome c-type biogenesis protein CcmH [Deltaproteobacteria bacterium]|nr:cytochrome c-type biogenesis protein CcmH [Deltaproteobacteria bacterium]
MFARLLAFALLMPTVAAAQPEPANAEEVVRQVMSPFCPGKVLSDCPSPRAAEWRIDVHQWASEGVPAPEIIERLQTRAPDFDLLRRPPPRETGALPIAAFALASLVLIWAARRLLSRDDSSDEADAARTLYDERLDEELARLGD